MKKVLFLLALVMFGMAFAVGTPTSYDDYYYDDDWNYNYNDDSACCCTGFILPVGLLVAGLGYTYYKKE